MNYMEYCDNVCKYEHCILKWHRDDTSEKILKRHESGEVPNCAEYLTKHGVETIKIDYSIVTIPDHCVKKQWPGRNIFACMHPANQVNCCPQCALNKSNCLIKEEQYELFK